MVKYTILVLLSALIFIGGRAFSAPQKPARIRVKPNKLSMTISALDLQAGAGSDLIDTYETDPQATSITIRAAGGWLVNVKKIDTNWHSDLHLYVQRTSDGVGDGSISGPYWIYIEITDFDQEFFNGTGDRRKIYVQTKVSGVSVQIPPDTYSTTIYYTVVDN